MKNIKRQGLCYRCEHRANFYETGEGSRCECKSPEMSVNSCYMYRPVRPVVIKRNDGDERPQFGLSIISARSHFVRLADEMIIDAFDVEDGGVVLYYKKLKKIKEKKNSKKIKNLKKEGKKL